MTSGQRTFFADERHAELLPTDVDLVVYTNSIPVLTTLLQRGIDVAFLGTNGLSFQRGLTTPDADEALVKHEMLAAARQRVFLVDTSKFGRESCARHATLTHVDVLVTDEAVTPEQRARLLAVDVTVEVAR